jgi:ParB family chromosome partitioning protein
MYMGEMTLDWVHINSIIPNPLNPRKNSSVKSEEMQRIIKDKGWETGITCYARDSKYVILSGHRRWVAAKRLGIKQLPVILVKAPLSELEELERLISVQGGKVDWNVYEWAKHIYEMWLRSNKCSYEELSRKTRKRSRWIAEIVKVFQYYPHNEIESKLIGGSYSFLGLHNLIIWLDRLSNIKPEIVDFFTIEMIRTTMLLKIENKLVNSSDLRSDLFIRMSSIEQMKTFLLENNLQLSEALHEINNGYEDSRIRTHIEQINNTLILINEIDVNSKADAKEVIFHFQNLRNEVLLEQKKVRRFLKSK